MGPGIEISTFVRGTLLGKRFFFRVVDTGNWEILSASQPYKTKHQRDETANRLARLIGCPVIPERHKR